MIEAIGECGNYMYMYMYGRHGLHMQAYMYLYLYILYSWKVLRVKTSMNRRKYTEKNFADCQSQDWAEPY